MASGKIREKRRTQKIIRRGRTKNQRIVGKRGKTMELSPNS